MERGSYPLVLLFLKLVFGLLQLLLDLLDVFVHLADGRVKNFPDVKSRKGKRVFQFLF